MERTLRCAMTLVIIVLLCVVATNRDALAVDDGKAINWNAGPADFVISNYVGVLGRNPRSRADWQNVRELARRLREGSITRERIFWAFVHSQEHQSKWGNDKREYRIRYEWRWIERKSGGIAPCHCYFFSKYGPGYDPAQSPASDLTYGEAEALLPLYASQDKELCPMPECYGGGRINRGRGERIPVEEGRRFELNTPSPMVAPETIPILPPIVDTPTFPPIEPKNVPVSPGGIFSPIENVPNYPGNSGDLIGGPPSFDKFLDSQERGGRRGETDAQQPEHRFVPGSTPTGFTSCKCFSSYGLNGVCRKNGCVEPEGLKSMECFWECQNPPSKSVYIRGRDGKMLDRRP